MPARETVSFEVGHPAPDAGRVGLGMLTLGFAAAPLAWSLQLAANISVSGLACTYQVDRVGGGAWGWPTWTMLAVNIAALAAGVAGLLLARRNLGRTRRDAPRSERGIMDAGEGRSRYLAVWGVWTSVLFLLAIAFNTLSLFWGAGLCAS